MTPRKEVEHGIYKHIEVSIASHMRERREKEIFDIWTDRKFGKFRHNYPGKEYFGRRDRKLSGYKVNPLGLFSGVIIKRTNSSVLTDASDMYKQCHSFQSQCCAFISSPS